MATRLHTAVGDEIRRIAETDPERAAEMRMESVEYHNEVMGRYDDAEYDPYDDADYERDYEREADECPECGEGIVRGDECPSCMEGEEA